MEGLYIIPCSGPSESLAGVVISPQLEAIARPGFCDIFGREVECGGGDGG